MVTTQGRERGLFAHVSKPGLVPHAKQTRRPCILSPMACR